jgi:hypothetical protein
MPEVSPLPFDGEAKQSMFMLEICKNDSCGNLKLFSNEKRLRAYVEYYLEKHYTGTKKPEWKKYGDYWYEARYPYLYFRYTAWEIGRGPEDARE